MSLRIDKKIIEAAVLGGAILGGGGGGWIEEGRKLAQVAVEKGFSEILSIEDLPQDAVLLTVSGVGAPSAGGDLLEPIDYVRAVELFIEKTGMKIDGLISSEIGALGVVNGWIQSAALNIPVIDAPCNGRAHPSGLMGSMGLHRQEGYVLFQTAVGGKIDKGNRVEAFYEGPLADASKSVREASVRAGGMVAVARNPVPAHYVRENGAPGAIQMAMALGKILLKNKKADLKKTLKEIYDFLGVDFIIKGKAEEVAIKTEGGLDIGTIQVRTPKRLYELTFWNEYMTFATDDTRIATFPDLIMTFDSRTLMPLISAQIEGGMEVIVIAVPAQQLILGAGMRDDELMKQVEKAIGKEIVRFGK
jgi:DUF917 family protein